MEETTEGTERCGFLGGRGGRYGSFALEMLDGVLKCKTSETCKCWRVFVAGF